MVKKITHFLSVLAQLGVIILIFEMGSYLQRSLNLFIPGSIIGLLILFALLSAGFKLNFIQAGAAYMNKHLVLFFVPVTIGLVNHLDEFSGKGAFLIPTVMISTLAVMISASTTATWLRKRSSRD